MAIHTSRLTLQLQQAQTPSVSSAALAALPVGTIVATFDSRRVAVDAAVQILTTNPDALVWVGSGTVGAKAIRAARGQRGIAVKLLRGFGDEEAMVREVIRQAETDRSVLVVGSADVGKLGYLADAAHVYQFGLWTINTIR